MVLWRLEAADKVAIMRMWWYSLVKVAMLVSKLWCSCFDLMPVFETTNLPLYKHFHRYSKLQFEQLYTPFVIHGHGDQR